MQARVLDTNIVLDLWVFQDPGAEPLRESLKPKRLDLGGHRGDAGGACAGAGLCPDRASS